MEMRQYLRETFLFNDAANKNMLTKIESLPDKQECIRHFSHLINSQFKWMARIRQDPQAAAMSWWDPVYPQPELYNEWERSLRPWLELLEEKEEKGLFAELAFDGYDGGRWKARLVDIALQLNYHSIHHRAQMQRMIREQGVIPDFIDYIGTKYIKLN